MESFGDPEDLLKELAQMRGKKKPKNPMNEVWTAKQKELNSTYRYDRSTIVVCVLLVLFCLVFWILFISKDMFQIY